MYCKFIINFAWSYEHSRPKWVQYSVFYFRRTALTVNEILDILENDEDNNCYIYIEPPNEGNVTD